MKNEMYAGRRAVFIVVEPKNIFHSLDGPRSDDKAKMAFQTEHFFVYVINRTGGALGDKWNTVANAARTLIQVLGDEVSSMRDLTARPPAGRTSKQQQAANDKTERMF